MARFMHVCSQRTLSISKSGFYRFPKILPWKCVLCESQSRDISVNRLISGISVVPWASPVSAQCFHAIYYCLDFG